MQSFILWVEVLLLLLLHHVRSELAQFWQTDGSSWRALRSGAASQGTQPSLSNMLLHMYLNLL
jgi:hypothetical protein